MIIKFNRLVRFIGRNGYFRQSGIGVYSSFGTNPITIQPITSKGVDGNCQIEVPREDIPALIAALQKELKRA